MDTSVVTWLRLARIFQKIDRASELHLRNWQLNVAQFDILAQVGSNKGVTQQELANHLLVTKGNVSQLIDRMESMNLLQRQQEGRTKILSLTQAGRELYNQVIPEHEKMISSQFTHLSKEDLNSLLYLLRKLDHSLR